MSSLREILRKYKEQKKNLEKWENALAKYRYPKNKSQMKNLKINNLKGYFARNVKRDEYAEKQEIIDFEKYFRKKASNINVIKEAIFWKLAFKPGAAKKFVNNLTKPGKDYVNAIKTFKTMYKKDKRKRISSVLKLCEQFHLKDKYKYIVPFALVSLYYPKEFPMIDEKIGRWVDDNYPFYSGLRKRVGCFWVWEEAWIEWCNKMAWELSITELKHLRLKWWRPRDVEMAVFVAQDSSGTITLNPI